jgi:putative hydrolase of the HAD superfamily
MAEPPPSAILLDALGTLVALDPPVPRLRAELVDRFGLEVSEQAAERALMAEIAFYRVHLNEGRDPAALGALRRRCAEVLRAALPPSPVLATVSGEALTAALLASLHFRAFEDAAPALLHWRRAGIELVVVSNWDASLHEVLERVELAPLVRATFTSAEVGARKPAPVIFAEALAAVRVDPARALHVGDSLEEDVAGARSAGIEPVLIRRGGEPGPADVRTVASLAELAQVTP